MGSRGAKTGAPAGGDYLGWDLPDEWDAPGTAANRPSAAPAAAASSEPSAEPAAACPDRRRTDPREREEWFARLPEEERQRIRDRWRWETGRFEDYTAWDKRRRRNAIRNCAIMFFLVQLLQWGCPTWALLLAVGIGAALGWTWHRIGAGRIARVATAVPVYFVMQGLLGIGRSGTVANPAPVMFMMYGGLAIAAMAAATGLLSESDEQDGPNG